MGAERALRKLRSEILDMGGSAVLLSCAVLAGATEVHTAFQAARDDEYAEIVDRCEDFLAQVKKEHVAGHYTYAELEENEVDLEKLQKWFARVRERDAGLRQAYLQGRGEGAGGVRGAAGGVRDPRLRRGSREPLSPNLLPVPLAPGQRTRQAPS